MGAKKDKERFPNIIITNPDMRIVDIYGGRPQYILSSATVDDAREFAQILVGQKFFWIKQNGAPSGKRFFVLWESTLSPYTEAIELFMRCVDQGLKTILFTKTRRGVELILSRIKDSFPEYYD